ncbi:MAG TPA: SCP2 sterol-binding domain-containing protein [Candidatus Dormibacteraeota bacterium]|nr:SCP2 sterol-binding domain-containing protein [Candidatus Dormibacteraeota bacterium]
MAYKAFSDEWAQAYKNEINISPVYKQAAAAWEGTVGLVVEAEADKNFPEAKGVWMDLWHGEARDIKIVSEADAEKADFVIRGPYSRWKQVAQKELDSTKAMMQGKLKLKGDLPTIVRFTKASQEMTECTTRIAVEYPDEQ